ncbi:glycoside hydrolase family 32 protein [Macrococcus equipercicus]|uniref:Sucrose-6-phosphate hydrolase n=1 Tax=Macrococcus equipercicus TaxID=69967 RepID=A0A9Q9BN00_9STAP|nr:sucrose-6-phosphate hydrolase [Macrococcus equipercicus]KAA1036570.1 sucrose-6-phosphate hydrolase [Macrococcus equipercicus]UTH13500.1 sucrose-6-phosphate hydrolase [Macrococcus equipercicus]
MEWTREMRYRKLSDVPEEEYLKLLDETDRAPWRQHFHIQPPTGLLNDPNGFVYYKGEYHLFYQWFPLGAVHGVKYWYHLTSHDLVTFKAHGAALAPDTTFDSHGVYSGSAIVVDEQLHVVYTGNHRTADWERIPYQLVAVLTSQDFVKREQPIIKGPHTGYTEHFRDPKVWFDNGSYFAVIGAQRLDQTGTIVVYRSPDFKDWEFVSELKTDYTDFGYMWECPDYFELDGHDVILFCPQGVEADGEQYKNIHQSGYLLGTLDKETFQMTHGDFIELDHGFDFYAPQTTLAEDGRRLLIGWMGLPDTAYPTDAYNWANCLTIPRELTVEDGRLRQRPLKEWQKRRGTVETAEGYAMKHNIKLHPYEGNCYELLVDIIENESTEFYIELRVSKKESTLLSYNQRERRFTLDRSESGQLAGDEDTRRSVVLEHDLRHIQVFMDESSIEIFLNHGERVMTARIFPAGDARGIRTSTESGQVYFKFTKYQLLQH